VVGTESKERLVQQDRGTDEKVEGRLGKNAAPDKVTPGSLASIKVEKDMHDHGKNKKRG